MLYVILGIVLFIFFSYKIIKPSKYWEEKDVVHAKSWPLVGTMKDFVWGKQHLSDIMLDIYNQFPNDRSVGFMQFTKPCLMVKDLDLIKKMTTKDSDHFYDGFGLENIDSHSLLSKSLIRLTGDNWRRMKATPTPIFTSGKMMYNLITECAQNFTKHLEGKHPTTIEMEDVSSKFANDAIATTAFGVTVNSFKDPNNDFFKMGSDLTQMGSLSSLKVLIMHLAPKLAKLLHLKLFKDDATMFFRSIVLNSIKIRETDGIVRPDLIHLLMEARKGHLKQEEDEEECQTGKSTTPLELTDDHIVAQALTIFFAGFHTISTGCSFMAYELALHPEIQKKLQDEIDRVIKKYDEKVPYEALLDLKYLDQIVCETLRLWPPEHQVHTVCVKDYVIEPKHPKEKVVFVAKGNSVVIPTMALHRDPKYFKNPNKFDPFGAGPRNCIGEENSAKLSKINQVLSGSRLALQLKKRLFL